MQNNKIDFSPSYLLVSYSTVFFLHSGVRDSENEIRFLSTFLFYDQCVLISGSSLREMTVIFFLVCRTVLTVVLESKSVAYPPCRAGMSWSPPYRTGSAPDARLHTTSNAVVSTC